MYLFPSTSNRESPSTTLKSSTRMPDPKRQAPLWRQSLLRLLGLILLRHPLENLRSLISTCMLRILTRNTLRSSSWSEELTWLTRESDRTIEKRSMATLIPSQLPPWNPPSTSSIWSQNSRKLGCPLSWPLQSVAPNLPYQRRIGWRCPSHHSGTRPRLHLAADSKMTQLTLIGGWNRSVK